MNINKSLFWNNGNGHNRHCVMMRNSISNDENTFDLNFSSFSSLRNEKLRTFHRKVENFTEYND